MVDSVLIDVQSFSKIVLRIGYQKEKTYKKIIYYKGIDLLFQTAKIDYNYKNTNYYSGFETGSLSVAGFGFCPFLGLKIKINELFSVSTETRLKFAVYEVKRDFSGNYFNPNVFYIGKYVSHHLYIRFSPFGLISFNIHLAPKPRYKKFQ